MNANRHPVSPRAECLGMVYVPRMCDKIRLHAAGKLDAGYHANLGQGMDEWTCRFLHVDYALVRDLVLAGKGDEEVLRECCTVGRQPNDFEIGMFNEFMSKRGFRDALSERLAQRKEESGASGREDIRTFFDYIDFDEGRMVAGQAL